MYVNMRVEDDTRDVPIIITLGRNQNAHALVRKSWMLFECAACECAKEADKTRMFAVIEQYPGGVRAFNNFLRAVAASVLDLPRDSSSRMSGESSASSASSARLTGTSTADCVTRWSALNKSLDMLDMSRNNYSVRESDVRPLGVSVVTERNVSCIGAACDSLADVVPGSVLSEPHASG